MSLFKKLDVLEDLLKQFNASIKQPKMPTIKIPKSSTPKIPGNPVGSQKDPIKQAQQVTNPEIKPIAMDAAKRTKESLKTSKNGQWSLNKADEAQRFHIHKDGYQITDKPMTVQQINEKHGSVQRLESSGHTLIPHKPKV